jgi:hypothetical protein
MASKEQIKTRAAFLNSVASGSVVASVITPAVGLSIGMIQWSSNRLLGILTACAFWFVIAVIFHMIAYRLAEFAE